MQFLQRVEEEPEITHRVFLDVDMDNQRLGTLQFTSNLPYNLASAYPSIPFSSSSAPPPQPHTGGRGAGLVCRLDAGKMNTCFLLH